MKKGSVAERENYRFWREICPVRAERKSRRWTQARAGERAGLPHARVSSIESGQELSPRTWTKNVVLLAEAFREDVEGFVIRMTSWWRANPRRPQESIQGYLAKVEDARCQLWLLDNPFLLLREAKQLSVEELSEASGVSKSKINDLELRVSTEMPVNMTMRIADALGVDLGRLLQLWADWLYSHPKGKAQVKDVFSKTRRQRAAEANRRDGLVDRARDSGRPSEDGSS